jgi:hypothetical protein
MSGSSQESHSCLGCTQCDADDPARPEAGALRGWRLTVSATAVFLLPLALAVTGAALLGSNQTRQFLGALGGLAVGMGCGILIARSVGRSAKEGA